MKEKKLLSKKDKSELWSYLFYTFGIAWVSELLILALYSLGLLKGGVGLFIHYGVIGFGAGMAPAYAAFIIWNKKEKRSLKGFIRNIFYTADFRKTIVYLLVFALIQFTACAVQESYLGNPWYLFILFIPFMIFGGGLEEVGWRGILQPLFEKRFSFLTAALIEGVIWSVWHLPLWLIPNTSQRAMNFPAFALYTIILGLTLAAAYRLTNSIWASILLHAWGNTVLGGMYTLTTLNNFPDARTFMVYGIQAGVILLLLFYSNYYK